MKRMGDDGEGSEDFARKVASMMRDFARAALDDPRKQQADLEMLDRILSDRATGLFTDVLRCSGKMYGAALGVMPDERNMLLSKALVDKTFNPVITHEIDLNTAFTDFYRFQIKELPGYIKLHEAAKAIDVAVDVSGLSEEERREPGGPRITINVFKSYEEGEADTTYGYPTPPEPKEEDIPAATPSRQSLKPGLKIYTM